MPTIKNFAYYGWRKPDASILTELWDMQSGEVACDIETVSLDNRRPLGMSFALGPKDCFYFPMESPVFPWHILKNPNIAKIFHNGHFDLGVIKDFYGLDITPIKDTIIAAHILGYQPALGVLMETLFREVLVSVEDLIGKKGKSQLGMDQIPEDQVAFKACQDAESTLRVWHKFRDEVPPKAFDLEMRVLPTLLSIERMGMRIDVPRLLEHKTIVEKEVLYYRGIAKGYGFNPGSSPQVAAIMQSRGLPIYYTKKSKQPTITKQLLSTVYAEDPMAQMVRLYRANNILLTTFINATLNKHLQGDRIFGRIHQITTNSGRFSRTKPNLQNIPPSMRDIFIPSEGCVYEAWDLSQIELRILAYLVWMHTGDRTMQAVFEANGDIHTETANEIGCTRRLAKDLNFAVTYGGDEYTLYQRGGVDPEVGKEYIARYFAKYPGVQVLIGMVYK